MDGQLTTDDCKKNVTGEFLPDTECSKSGNQAAGDIGPPAPAPVANNAPGFVVSSIVDVLEVPDIASEIADQSTKNEMFALAA